jgi:hypothetical protein
MPLLEGIVAVSWWWKSASGNKGQPAGNSKLPLSQWVQWSDHSQNWEL